LISTRGPDRKGLMKRNPSTITAMWRLWNSPQGAGPESQTKTGKPSNRRRPGFGGNGGWADGKKGQIRQSAHSRWQAELGEERGIEVQHFCWGNWASSPLRTKGRMRPSFPGRQGLARNLAPRAGGGGERGSTKTALWGADVPPKRGGDILQRDQQGVPGSGKKGSNRASHGVETGRWKEAKKPQTVQGIFFRRGKNNPRRVGRPFWGGKRLKHGGDGKKLRGGKGGQNPNGGDLMPQRSLRQKEAVVRGKEEWGPRAMVHGVTGGGAGRREGGNWVTKVCGGGPFPGRAFPTPFRSAVPRGPASQKGERGPRGTQKRPSIRGGKKKKNQAGP